MQQPELGRRLTALRKEKNLTQEQLVAKSNVSVRTIQRIESGEVLPRMSTVKILIEALGETYESFSKTPSQVMETQTNTLPSTKQNTLLIAALAGTVYLVTEIILSAMDIAWMVGNSRWEFWTNAAYVGLTAIMIVSFIFFARGFIALSRIFENNLLKAVAYMLIAAIIGRGILDVSSVGAEEVEALWIPYLAVALLFGALSIAFGIALLRLQDGMGELSRIAGIMEIVMGCMLATVVLFFLSYIIFIPATALEIILLYRGYEYISRLEPETR